LISFQNKKPVIAIDGTAGSGKGTLAKKLSKSLQFDHLDSGMLYRLFAYEFLKQNESIRTLESVSLNLDLFFDKKKIDLLDLRTEEITEVTSKIAKKKIVRQRLISFQRNFANRPPNGNGSVIDGRDIASKIIPNAEIKFFIDARIEIRAKRRQKQLNLENESYKKILKKMIKRDKQDIERLESPLVRTKDSHLIDTSKISENEAFQIAINYIKKKTDFI